MQSSHVPPSYTGAGCVDAARGLPRQPKGTGLIFERRTTVQSYEAPKAWREETTTISQNPTLRQTWSRE